MWRQRRERCADTHVYGDPLPERDRDTHDAADADRDTDIRADEYADRQRHRDGVAVTSTHGDDNPYAKRNIDPVHPDGFFDAEPH